MATTKSLAIVTGAGQGASGPLGTPVTVCRSLWRRFRGVSLD
jgi:hypothetical protein